MADVERSLLERAGDLYDYAPVAGLRYAPVVLELRPVTATESATTRWEGVVDRHRMAMAGFATLDEGVTAIAEEFRLVKRALLQAATVVDGRPSDRMILIASALPGEGKTFCAVSLALSIAAEKDYEVVLVDGDVVRPSIPALLGLDDGPGLMDAIADPALDVERCIVRTDLPNLSILPAGRAGNDATELLASGRTRGVLDRIATHVPNRIILFDSPPLLTASPASELAHHVGHVVLVVRADRTSESAVQDAVRLLSGGGEVRLLLNAATLPSGGQRFGTYADHAG